MTKIRLCTCVNVCVCVCVREAERDRLGVFEGIFKAARLNLISFCFPSILSLFNLTWDD